ncbi:cytochrome P450 [Rhodococcus rhodochrous]|uniref:Cytochrome P450 n=1 Tax=Rhodococcus rhodochrous J45 TaxID=935266 RepID=A0A562E4Q0_RHORH|nr:cytochrome P450 [Rhodococcus rhodochrous]TWH16747.1 cytochrome P450 [Rhodococcus rhodochrous J45]
MTSSPPTADVDLFADGVLVDPYPTFAQLRELGPVVYLPRHDVYALTRYDVIRGALADTATFSSRAIAFNPAANDALRGTSLASDPPVHTELRATLTENLSPRALRGLKTTIEAKADTLVADLVTTGSFEAIDALARAFPLEVVADLIGFTGKVRANMLRWGQAAMEVLGPMNQRTAENFPIAGELYAWCSQVQAEDLTPGSVGRGIFDAEARGAVPAGSAGHIIHQYLGAGVDTTIASIGNLIALFAAFPDQFDLVRADPALVPSAFAEVLRYWAPLHAWGRAVTRDVEIDGHLIPGGSQAAVLLGSGNRDPRHYDDPDAFRVARNPVDHLSFGYGPHGCAGQGLARLEAHAIIAALARHARRLVAAEPIRVPGNTTRSIDALEILEVVPA